MGLDIMKKTYISPELQVAYLAEELPIAESNKIQSKNGSVEINFNPGTMGDGDGGDAVKSNTYDVWDDDWSR